MLRHKITSALAGLFLAAGVAGSANALSITAGDIKFTIDNYDAGTTGYGDTDGTKCTTVLTCDTAASSPAPGAVGSEDTWGIFSVAAITNISTGQTLFTRGVDGFLTGVFYGLEDYLVAVSNCLITGCSTTAFAINGSVDLYMNASDYDPSLGPGGRIGTTGYTGISNTGTLYLSANFGTGVNSVQPAAEYQTSYNNTTFAGAGQGFLDITGGSAQSTFDTNSLTDTLGAKHDLFLDVTFNDVNGAASNLGWTVTSSGQVKGAALPEPGVLALIGLGGMLAGWVSRRRRTVGN